MDTDLAQVNGLGEQLMQAGRTEEALALFDLAAARDKGNPLYVNNRAVARAELGDLPGAVRDLERAITFPDYRRLATLNYSAIGQTHARFVGRALVHCRDYLASGCPDEGGRVAAAIEGLQGQVAIADAWLKDWVAGMPHSALEKVNHSAKLAEFLKMGEALANLVLEQVEGLRAADTILDFGVGLGRVLWPLIQAIPSANFIGYDVDPVMINAVRNIQEMAAVRLLYSTSDIPDDSVDAAVVISVFTHLDVTTDYWLGELKRILKPGGRAFITFHDDTIYREIYDANEIRHDTPRDFRGRVTTGQGAQGSTLMASFYETAEWERTLGRCFRVVKTVPRGCVRYQSFSVVEKVDNRDDVLAHQRTYIRDLEGDLYRLRESVKLEF
jgi:SAM-dependent methyltransferase